MSSTTRFAVFDIETTGLDPEHDRILQIAIVTCDLDLGRPPSTATTGPSEVVPPRIVERWCTLIRLGWPLGRVGATHIHGLRRRDLVGAPSMRSALRSVARRLEGVVPVAHNAGFDAGFLLRAAHQQRVDLDLDQVVCTLRMSRALDPGRRLSHRLGDLCDRLGISLDRPHDALHDAEATAEALPHLLAGLAIGDPAELAPFSTRATAGQRSGRRSSDLASG